MEDLNQRQLVLLIILVGFVTSIATSIITVSLLDYAPPSVTSNVERVVERTVEYVSPQEVEKKEVTEVKEIVEERVIDRGDDIISDADNSARPAGVSVFKEEETQAQGVIISEKRILLPFVAEEGSVYEVDLNEEEVESVEVEVIFSSDETGFSVAERKEDNEEVPFPEVKIAEATPERGSTVLHIENIDKKVLHVGRVAWLDVDEEGEVNTIGTDGVGSATSGAFITNLAGEIWGVQLNEEVGSYTNIFVIKDAIKEFEEREGDDTEENNDDEEGNTAEDPESDSEEQES
ncbi:MAG: hypothetical protein ACLFNR_01460 [Candidatus Paceibacterota bacterium]